MTQTLAAAAAPPPFRAVFAPDDVAIAARLLPDAGLPPGREARIDATARALVEAVRQAGGRFGGIEALLREYALSTPEGVALMMLAEGLLRVPDDDTADALIEDKLRRFEDGHAPRSDALLVGMSAWALGLGARIATGGETPASALRGMLHRLGMPTVRAATRQAMRLMGNQFVLGQGIDEALARAARAGNRAFRYSFDMLGEGARTEADARRYAASYAAAIAAIARAAGNRPLPDRPGISVKLSALHPTYDAVSAARVMEELVPRVAELAAAARNADLGFTIDAEEQDRLEISLDVIEAVARDPRLAGWDGFGLAIQAYGKRALSVIDWAADLARTLGRRFTARLVKGAYWDTEIKRAQERGLPDYPVFTRKPMTDLHYMACAERMLALRPLLWPQFASHNALTVASVLERAGDVQGYEFQRLHGMGDALYPALLRLVPGVGVRTYAPVGEHRDLLAYLVRRLLENGANSSFVARVGDPSVPVADLLRRPAEEVGEARRARNEALPLPGALYGPARRNPPGVEFGVQAERTALLRAIAAETSDVLAAPLIDGAPVAGPARPVLAPATGEPVGRVIEADAETAARAMAAAARGFPAWERVAASERAAALMRAADAFEAARGRLVGLLAREGGRTLEDGIAEWREAIDFLRYYAVQARRLCSEAGERLPGPTGESNVLRRRGRGVFVCISPWNFPLAIFTGQVAAALAAGNAVVAKPAPQTPLVAAEAVRLLHAAGVPASALHLVPGGPPAGAALVAHEQVAGVAFTGSTATAQAIARTLAAREGAIPPFIAETGGVNVMIADATALPEQLTDDAVVSAFRSAGQRCSALRLLAVQEDVADRVIAMLAGAAAELRLGDPLDPATRVGPVIDAAARDTLNAYLDGLAPPARLLWRGQAPQGGTFVAPAIVELPEIGALRREVFGPILHIARWRAGELDRVIEAVGATGFGLTLGIHSRIDGVAERIASSLRVGNVYVNRSMIGAVVGVQPFGGTGLSGTGPKAGGPDYLRRFATEQTVTVNTAAAGGDAALLSM